jgi:hypothetical protein
MNYKNVIYLFSLLVALGTLSSCAHETPSPNGPVSAEVYYDFLAYSDYVQVDVEILNSGNFNVREATYEIELYGWEGEFLGSYRESARLNLFPGESVFLSHDLWEYDVFEVYVRIIEVW